MNKTLFLLASLLVSAVSAAQDVRLAWDASPTLGVTNYILYAHTNSLNAANLTNAAVRLNVGTNLTARVESLVQGQWFFAATAMKANIESPLSNVVQVEVPEAPKNMRTVVLQFSGTLTNFFDVGFFRLRLP